MNMSRNLRPLAALAMVALIGAGCSDTPAQTSTRSSGGNENATDRDKAVRFSECMRDNGVSAFPDPDASGELTIDAIANGSSLDPNTAAFESAISACKDLQPAGFTGHERSAREQAIALKFAACMRDNGVSDFPDPTSDSPLIDTRRIPSLAGQDPRASPGFTAAQKTCGDVFGDALGIKR